jgi:hypothetical protein
VSIGSRFRLPISGASVALRETTGVEDLLLAEHEPYDPKLALTLIQRLAKSVDSAHPELPWDALSITDVDVIIVRLRQMLFGDLIVAEITCSVPDCASRVDMSFGLEAYLAHHRPARRAARGRDWRVEASIDGPAWQSLRVGGTEVARFRLPTLADQVAVYSAPDAHAALASRCISHVAREGSRIQTRVEAAMAALAPPLAGPLHGACPDCGTAIPVRFEARLYCLQELRGRARFVYDDVDTLAERYHWSERAILALPHGRRSQYAERARRSVA